MEIDRKIAWQKNKLQKQKDFELLSIEEKQILASTIIGEGTISS
jgi:hypothetical protein